MIAYVEGILKQIEENSVVIDTGGIGYRVFTPITEKLLRIGLEHHILLHTYLNVREDAMLLYGFLDLQSLELFRMLINVNGVGPRYAIGILSTLGVDEVFWAIAQGDHKALTKAPGIGAKTAQRIILDLKDKIASKKEPNDSIPSPGLSETATADNSLMGDAVLALEALGYTHSQAAEAVRKIPDREQILKNGGLQQLIREGLKQLAV